MNIQKVAIALLSLCLAGNASAGWISITDPNGPGSYPDNPGTFPGGTGPSTQSAADVGDWIQDLKELTDAPALLLQGDSTPSSLTGLDALGALYISLHYGNYPDNPNVLGNVNFAYECDGQSSCDVFGGYETQGLSGFRIYGGSTSIPEPGSLALLGLGLLSLGLSRKLRKP